MDMKKLLTMLSVAGLLIAGCNGTSDTDELEKRVDNLESRVTRLETLVAQLSANISGLVTAVDALQNQDVIEAVTPLSDGRGYTITFSKSDPIVIYNGNDGETPAISVVLDSDGQYYWRVNGSYVYVDGQKVPAVKEVSPQLHVSNEGHLEISYNGGQDWIDLGEAGLSSPGIFESVQDSDTQVVFVLAEDGSRITIPKVQSFRLTVADALSGIDAGATVTFNYSLTSPDDKTIVDCIPSEGYTAVVTQSNKNSGKIAVTAPNPLVDGKVFVFAVNDQSITSSRILYFEEKSITIDTYRALVPLYPEGQIVSLPVVTNVKYNVQIPFDAMDWLSYSVTKASHAENQTLRILAQPNTGTSLRSADVIVTDEMGMPIQAFTLVQKSGISAAADTDPSNPDGFQIVDIIDDGTIKL